MCRPAGIAELHLAIGAERQEGGGRGTGETGHRRPDRYPAPLDFRVKLPIMASSMNIDEARPMSDTGAGGAYPPPERMRFEEDEGRFPWLSMLLDAYFVADRGVAGAIAKEQKARELACSKGCASCCRVHLDIPVYPLELVGMTWYAAEKVEEPVRSTLREQLAAHRQGEPCPFLVEDACSIHPMRPMACRQFNVFGTPCAEEEDAFHSRPDDVLQPDRSAIDEALTLTLPFYGILEGAREVVEAGLLNRVVQELQQCNWGSVAKKMEEFDAASGEEGASGPEQVP